MGGDARQVCLPFRTPLPDLVARPRCQTSLPDLVLRATLRAVQDLIFIREGNRKREKYKGGTGIAHRLRNLVLFCFGGGEENARTSGGGDDRQM